MITSRFSDIVSGLDKYTFHILGCGAIGSSAALQLARTGAENFCLYDFDKVETENIGVSQYYDNDVNKYKVDALKSHILNINNHAIVNAYCEKFTEYKPEMQTNIIILGFDSMIHRLEAVEVICKADKDFKPSLLIDGRMGAEHYQQYIFNQPTLNEYRKTWYSDEEGSPEPCNAKATSYCSNMSGSFIVNAVRKLLTSQPYHKELSFHFPTMNLDKSKMIA